MSNIGILAYGSLIDYPGKEIKELIDSRIENIETPFKIAGWNQLLDLCQAVPHSNSANGGL